MELNQLKAWELKKLLESQEVSSREVLESVLDRIKSEGKSINSFITLMEDDAQKAAFRVDKKRSSGKKLGALAGIPVAIKDNICVKDNLCTCGSGILKNFISPYDATAVELLKGEDAVIVGKTNMDEFGMGSSNENSYFGPVKNPYDLERTPGGSSGGSAACLASDMSILALGSDTGGSVRLPASFCGVVGLKPTYGLISRYGLVAFASSLDQIGCLTKDVKDCAMLLSAVSGYDQRDSTSINIVKKDYTKSLEDDLKNIKIGVPKEYLGEGLNKEVKGNVLKGIEALERQGFKTSEISMPGADRSIAVYYVLCMAEASSNLARYDGARYGFRTKETSDLDLMYKKTRTKGFGDEVKRRIILGTYVLSKGYFKAYYQKAQKVRTIVKKDFDRAFEKVDFLITPTSPTTAFKLREKIEDPLTMYLSDVYTTSANLAGIPAISLPCGKDSLGLPIGLQIMGKQLSEELLLKLAYTFEQKLKR